jgi:hypothetical protein
MNLARPTDCAIPVPAAQPPRRFWWVLVAFAGLMFTALVLNPGLLRVLGVNHYGVWCLDLSAILASNDALARGLDPYAPNPLDVFGRPHVYAHWWLHLGRLGLTRGDALWLGFALAAAFFVAAVAPLRPRQPGEIAWSLVVLCSPPVLLALERANNDLVIFVLLAPVVPCLLSRRPGVRLLAVPLLALAAALKAYPAVGVLVLLAGVDRRDTRRLLFVAALVFLALLPDAATDFMRYAKIVPETEGLMTMGARNLFVGLGLPVATARVLGPLVGALVIAIFLRAKFFDHWTVAPVDRGAWLSFVLGATLLTGCFFAGASFAYRWVFALWLVPLLWRLPRDPAAPAAVRRLAAAAAALLIVALWADAMASSLLDKFSAGLTPENVLRTADRFFYLEQPVTWALFICLLGFLTHFAQEGVRRLFRAEPAAALSAQSVPASR